MYSKFMFDDQDSSAAEKLKNLQQKQEKEEKQLESETQETLYTLQFNPVFIFLNQRPPPTVIEAAAQQNKSVIDHERKRKIEQAGGYDYSLYTKRNWKEISREIRKLL
jgi:L-lactate utilization protein LutC